MWYGALYILSQLISSDTQFFVSCLAMDYPLLVGLHKECRELVIGSTVMSCHHCGVGHPVIPFVIDCNKRIMHNNIIKMYACLKYTQNRQFKMDTFNYGKDFSF
jgi:hypothetical protein